MPFPVEQLIKDRLKPTTVTQEETVAEALQLMITHDYSQLAVVDDIGHPQGLVTSDTIVRGLNYFGVKVNELYVRDVITPARTYTPERDVFELLEGLRDNYAVLIVDNTGVLTGIVTDYDTSEYFRRRAEDVMVVEDTELLLRSFVRAAFQTEQECQDDPLLTEAINKITTPPRTLEQFKAAVVQYLKLEHEGSRIKIASLTQAFEKLTLTTETPRSFEHLTFSEFEALFFSKDRWAQYEKAFTLDKEAIRKLLDDVRDIRNKVAHFRLLTEVERSRLKFCRDWLQRHESLVYAAFPKPEVIMFELTKGIESELKSVTALAKHQYMLVNTDSDQDQTKYSPLASHLVNNTDGLQTIQLPFSVVEQIIGSSLPPFAREHRSWWANDGVSHAQSKQWLDAGWRVSSVNMSDERVQFSRTVGRDKAYIDFFSKVVQEVKKDKVIPVRNVSPSGQSYHIITSFPEKAKRAHFIFVFGMRQKFRIELYIDCQDKASNEKYFDELHSEEETIESAFGHSLSWERLENRQASRIAYYIDGSITASTEELDELTHQSVLLMDKFYTALREPLERIIGCS